MIGPQDLALALGIALSGDWLSTLRLVDAIEEIRLTCERCGIVAGIGAAGGTVAALWLARGFRLVNVGNDLDRMASALGADLRKVRAEATGAVSA